MITHFKSVLDQIQADPILIHKTELAMKEALHKNMKKQAYAFPIRKMAFIVCFLIIMVTGSLGTYAYYWAPVSYLSLDINPSIEMSINGFGSVIGVTAINTDGENVIHNLKLIGNDVQQTLKEVIQSATDKGYITLDGSTMILITTEEKNAKSTARFINDAMSGIEEALVQSKYTASIEQDSVTKDIMGEARAYGISFGKLNLIYKLQSGHEETTIEQYRNASVKDIYQLINEGGTNNKKPSPTADITKDIDRQKKNEIHSTIDSPEEKITPSETSQVIPKFNDQEKVSTNTESKTGTGTTENSLTISENGNKYGDENATSNFVEAASTSNNAIKVNTTMNTTVNTSGSAMAIDTTSNGGVEVNDDLTTGGAIQTIGQDNVSGSSIDGNTPVNDINATPEENTNLVIPNGGNQESSTPKSGNPGEGNDGKGK